MVQHLRCSKLENGAWKEKAEEQHINKGEKLGNLCPRREKERERGDLEAGAC